MLLKKSLILFALILFCFSFTSLTGQDWENFIVPIVVGGPDQNYDYESTIGAIGPTMDGLRFKGFNEDGSNLDIHCDFTCLSNFGFGGGNYKPWYLWESPSQYWNNEFESGWVEVGVLARDPSEVINEITMKDKNTGELLSATSIPGVKPATKFLAPAYKSPVGPNRDGLARETSYAVVNPSETESATITMGEAQPEHEDANCDDISIVLPPRSQVTKYISEFFPECQIRSVLKFESDIPVAVSAFNVFEETYKFTALPVKIFE